MPAIAAITETNLLANNWVLAAALAEARVRRLLADRVSLRNSMFVDMVGDVARSGSKTSRVRHAGLGHSLSMTTAATETEEGAPANITIEQADVTVGRHYLILRESQLAQIITPEGDLDPDGLAATYAESWDGKFMDVLASTIQGFSTDVVNTAVDAASIDDVYDAIDEFEQNDMDAPLVAALHGKQIGDIRQSSRAEGGAVHLRTDVQDLQGMQGFQFEMFGINFFRVNRVASSGGSRHGAIWAPGAVGWNQGSSGKVKTSFGAVKPAGLPLIVEFAFTPAGAIVDVVGNAYFGEAIIDDNRGRGFVTAAA